MGRKEGIVEQALVRRVKVLGGYCIKLTGYKGIPDRMCILPEGRVVFVELKSSTGVLAEVQKYWLNYLRLLGHSAVAVNSLEAIDAWFPLEGKDG